MSLLACALHTPVFFVFCLAEIEAKEACDWLRAAGFPQYAQLYEGKTHSHTPKPQGRPVSHTQPLTLVAPSPVLFFPSSCCHRLLLAAAFYFQAPVLIRRDGSWERPSYHCWDSFTLLSSFFHLFPFSSCLLSLSLLLVFGTCPVCSPLLPPFLLRRSHYCRVSCI